jgi:predicted glycoside hydrolase/deacetylase ChbG (UPF0249 family)
VSAGLLIVNADDWGLRAEITDAISACYAQRRITSATAMVHMEDSRRAAELAAEQRLPLGLHLNLTYPYTGAEVPKPVRERQRRLAAYFAPSWTRWAFDPRARGLVADCVRDQREAFAAVYGAAPDHVDGHQHIQACPTVACSPALAGVGRVRPAHTYEPGERSLPARAARRVQTALLRRRFATPEVFVDIEDVHPALGGTGLERLEAARLASLEVMVHPQRQEQRDALLGEDWGRALEGHRLGTYADLG